MGRSIDHVQVPLSRATVELPWASRNELLDEIRRLPSMAAVVNAFENVGTSAPVRLTQPQKAALRDVIEVWGSQVEGGLTDGLPPGGLDLRNRLLDDLHDRQGDD